MCSRFCSVAYCRRPAVLYDLLLLRTESDGTRRVEPKQILCAVCGKTRRWPHAVNQREFARLKADPDAMVAHVMGEIRRHREADDGTMLAPPHAHAVVPLVCADGTDVVAADLAPLFRRWSALYAMRKRRAKDKDDFRAVRQRLEARQYAATPSWEVWMIILDVLALSRPTWDPDTLALAGRLCLVSRAFRTHITVTHLAHPLHTMVTTFGAKSRQSRDWRRAIQEAVSILGRGILCIDNHTFTQQSWRCWVSKTVEILSNAEWTPRAKGLSVHMDLRVLPTGSRRSALRDDGNRRVGRLLKAAAARLPVTLHLRGARASAYPGRNDDVEYGALVVNALLGQVSVAGVVVCSEFHNASCSDFEAEGRELGIWCGLRYGARLHLEDALQTIDSTYDMPCAALASPPPITFERHRVKEHTIQTLRYSDGPDPRHPRFTAV